jgi:phosphate-selective porin
MEQPPPAVPAPPVVAEPPPPPPAEETLKIGPPAAPAASEPLAGFSDGTAFLRSPDNDFVLLPSGRLQTDFYYFHTDDKNKPPNNTFLLRRARLELNGWIGGWVFFSLHGDFASGPPAGAAPAAPSNIATTDDYVGLAPWGTIAMLQVGQFDAPFTLENRTSDKYFDFMERSITVRAFGIPSNKEMGGMVHGYNDDRFFYYSLGVFNGDGQNFKNVDKKFDVMGRAWVAPLALAKIDPLHDATVGVSGWTGDRNNTLALPNQTTQAGFTFLSFSQFSKTVNGSPTNLQYRQVGRLNAVAGEINVPVMHKYGLRSEFVWKHSPLSLESIASSGAGTILGGANLKGWSTYVEGWVWVLGDDRIVGDQQGIEPQGRFKKFGVKPVQDGVMIAFRYEHLDEKLTEEADAALLSTMIGTPSAVGQTKVDSYELGINYWHSKRFRATFNYVFNHFGGDTAQIKGLASSNEQEFLGRLAIAL